MKTLLIGIGAAGNKAVVTAIKEGIISQDNAIIINSTSKDFPADFNGKKIILSPKDSGCGKERSIAREYALDAIKNKKLAFDDMNTYTSIMIITSVEGGTGSGATPIIAKYFNTVYNKNTHIIAFTGFEEDVRGLGNTIEFFKEVEGDFIVQTISNKSFLKEAKNNKFKAEALANEEMCRRIKFITGQMFIPSVQNIDDTDIMKVSNTIGYMTVEYIEIDKPLVDQDDFDKLLKKMIYDSKSAKSTNPKSKRIGAILNIEPATEDAIDYSFNSIKQAYGNPYECFIQKQWDENKEYVAFIISGMQMPIDEMKAVYKRYQEETIKVNKEDDDFYLAMKNMKLNESDNKFNMIKNKESGMNTDDFLKKYGS